MRAARDAALGPRPHRGRWPVFRFQAIDEAAGRRSGLRRGVVDLLHCRGQPRFDVIGKPEQALQLDDAGLASGCGVLIAVMGLDSGGP